ncbi:tetratricopeptide repeat protein [uncultured Kiloniella sp.]|uniref:tetratricopeptide repeat protein n=1 Tax=uncultured Kiloniella sp. TaxID=1133091 RepID=UPI00262A5EE0|nr:tetratricopeptide repeat protein [uncultured Kiloniella sp.]
MIRVFVSAFFLFISTQSFAETSLGLQAYENGDKETALYELREPAKNGDTTAQLYMGHIYREGIRGSLDYKQSAFWYLKAARRGQVQAQSFIGLYYTDGIGVRQDFDLAVHWLEKAAMQGHPIAQRNLGRFYEKGRGFQVDLTKAYAWYKVSSIQGNTYGTQSLRQISAKMTSIEVLEGEELAKSFPRR